MDTLTDRERALIELLARGHSNKVLAGELGISTNTVKFHLRNLYEKLAVSSRAQAIALYYTSSSRHSAPSPGAPPGGDVDGG